MTIYFVSDGTKYHDGDLEEVYGAIITDASRVFVQGMLLRIEGCTQANLQEKVAEACKNALIPCTYVQYDWEYETNVVSVRPNEP
jgi:hypothetical protein